MKVLFLDIDGVLNNSYTKEKCLGFTGVDKKLAKLLSNWLRKNTDISVVLSSTWRTDPKMWYAINAEGIEWIDVTDELNGRSQQIERWLVAHPDVTHYAIRDDQDYSWTEDQYKAFVHTNEHKGLTDEDLKKLDKIFLGPNEESETLEGQHLSADKMVPTVSTEVQE